MTITLLKRLGWWELSSHKDTNQYVWKQIQKVIFRFWRPDLLPTGNQDINKSRLGMHGKKNVAGTRGKALVGK